MKKIAVVTGSRADYGLLYWIIKGIDEDKDLELLLIATGMHLLPEFGLTVNKIEKDGFKISEKVDIQLSSDTETAIASSIGNGVAGFAKIYEKLQPDVLLVLGDRFEILSAVTASITFRIPVAHIHGGELTEGAIDEVFRHSITKMSHIHFAAAETYKKRIIQMGENPENVFCFGAPGLDNIFKLKLFDKDKVSELLGIPKNNKFGVVTFHPTTLEKNSSEKQINILLESLKEFPEILWIFTYPNADTGGRIIIKKINQFVSEDSVKRKIFISLGQLKYLSLLKSASIMVGNSSSGIIEAPCFELPVINIGDRQKGRIQAKNIIDINSFDKDLIKQSIAKGLSEEFKNSLKGMVNPFGNGNASKKIISALKKVSLDEKLIKKKFYDIN